MTRHEIYGYLTGCDTDGFTGHEPYAGRTIDDDLSSYIERHPVIGAVLATVLMVVRPVAMFVTAFTLMAVVLTVIVAIFSVL